jgi:hypothetical protein
MKALSDWSDDEIVAAIKQDLKQNDDIFATWCRTYRPDLWERVLNEVDGNVRNRLLSDNGE